MMKRRLTFGLLIAAFLLLFLSPATSFPGDNVYNLPGRENNFARAELPVIGFQNRSLSGTSTHLGDDIWRYTSQVGEINTWNGSHYVPYIWNDVSRIVTYAGHTLEFYDWFTILKNESMTVVDDIRWSLEYWNPGPSQWNVLDLYLHSYLPAVLNEDTMSFGYSMTDGSNTMNVTMTFKNNDEVKTQLDIHVVNTQIYRARWQLSGMTQDPVFVYGSDSDGDGTNDLLGAIFDNEINFMLTDVNQSELDCWYDWAGPQAKLDLYVGNVTIEAGNTLIIDPTFAVSGDTEDAYYGRGEDYQGFSLSTGTFYVWVGNTTVSEENRVGIFRIAVSIAAEQEILSATLSLWDGYASGDSGFMLLVMRTGGTNFATAPESLTEAPSNDSTYIETATTDGLDNDDWENVTVTRIVQDQIDESGWSSGNNMGFKVLENTTQEQFAASDYSDAAARAARVTVTYQAITTENVVDAISNLYAFTPDKGTRTDFSATQQGPDPQHDYLTERGYGDTIPVIQNDWTVTDTGGGTANTLELTKPAGASSGDLLIIIIGSDDSGSDDYFHDEAGWTRRESNEQGEDDDCALALFYREADGTEPATTVIDADDSDEQFGWYIRITGAADSDPIDAAWFDEQLDTVDIAGITTTEPKTVVLYALAYDGGDGDPFTNATSPWSEIDEQQSGTTGNDACGLWGYRDMSPRGDTGAIPVGAAGPSDGTARFQVSIRPSVVNYELDLEVGWTAADFSQTTEELCIYTGSQAAEALKVDVYSSGWTNVIADLSANAWNNVSISSYLTDATFEIRFLHNDNSSDTTQSTWEIDTILLHTDSAGANSVPANDQVPSVSNIDDSTFMYAQYKEYQMTVYVSDGDGFADIDYMEVSLWDNSQTTEYFRFRYDEDTDTFTEEYDSGTVVSLNVGSSSATETGNDIDATFYFTIDWDHADLADIDLECYVVDDEPESDTDWYEADFDVETRLDYSVAPAVTGDDSGTVDRGDLDESFTLDGTIIYYQSGDDNPASDQVDVWVSASEYGTNVGPWSDLTLTSGAFSVTCYGDDAVGQDTHTVKPVLEGAGSGGASQYYTTDLTDTYISDQIQVQTTTADDTRVDTSANSEIRVTLWLAYDNEEVGSGDSVTLDDVAMSWDGVNSWWDLARTQASVGDWWYFVNSSSEVGHGITGLDLNGQTQKVIFDEVIVISYSLIGGDDRIDTDATVTIDVTLDYDYDDSDVTDGTITVNGQSAAHQGSGVWRFTDSESTVVQNTYDTVVASGNTHGITVVNQNGQTETCIWDQVIVISYAISGGDDRIDTGATVTIDVTLDYDYDDSDVTDGTITVNSLSASHQGAGVWRFTDSEATVLMNTYDTVVASGNTHGITVVNQNGQTETCIWDEVQVQSYTPSDDRDNINDDVTIDVLLWYDYDNSLVTDGTVTINAIGAAHQGSGVWRITENKASVQSVTYDTVAATGNTHGITVVDQNGQSTSVIWDQIVVQTTVADDSRVDINANSEIRVTLWLDYDDSYLGSGDTVNLDDTAMSWDGGNSWFELTRSKSSVDDWTYFVNSSSEATYSITALDVNSQEVTVVWDRIKILTTTTQDGRIDYDTQADIRVTAELEYDSHALGAADTLYMNDTSMSWVSTYFQLQPQFAEVGDWWFFVNSTNANEVTYGITVVNLDGKNVKQVWDRLIIDQQADDETPNNGIEVTFTLTITFEYDSATCTTYQITVSRDAVHWYSFTNGNKSLYVDTNSDVSYDYTATSVTSESTYGILAFTTNTETVTWAPEANDPPVNDTTPTCADLDDTDNLYAYIRTYTIVVYVSDPDGFADIDYLEITLYSDDQVTPYWTVRYDEDTDTFTEQSDPSDYIYLDTGASSAVEAGNDIDATFKIRINWNHPNFADADFYAYVIDDDPESDADWFQDVGGWDYETRLDYSSAPAVSSDDSGTVDRGDLDETFSITGTIIYYGGTVNPTTAIVDVWISGSEYGSTPGPWSDLALTAGAFDVTCYADDAIGQDTYTIKVVIEGAGSGGADQYYTSSATDTYIADQITVQTTTADDIRLNINANSEIRVTLWLAYDASYLGSGDSVTLDDVGMNWDGGNSWFDLSRSQASVGDWWYFVNSSSQASHGITGLDLNSQNQKVIWDSLTVSLTNPSDQRIDISTSLSGMVASATYDYDNAAYDGTLVLNNTQFSYATAQKQGYKVDSATGDDTHGISVISSNPDETYCIWDSLTAIISPPTDQRININANASGMIISAVYDYDSAAYDGTLSLNDETYDHGTVGNYSYTVNAGDGDDTYGITVVSSANTTWCIFDRLMMVLGVDSNTPNNGQQVNFTLTMTFDYDDVECTTYNLQISRDGDYWNTYTNANKSLFKDTNSGVSYVYAGLAVTAESTYGITVFVSDQETVTWSAAGGDGGPSSGGRIDQPILSDPYFPVYVGVALFFGIGLFAVLWIRKPKKPKSIYKQMKKGLKW